MSLINDMLNDLEARRAHDLARPGLRGEVRPLPKVGSFESWQPRLIVAALALAAISAAAYFWLERAPSVQSATSSLPPLAVAPAPTPSALPVTPPAPVASPVVVEIQPAVLPAGIAPLAIDSSGLRASDALSFIPPQDRGKTPVAAQITAPKIEARSPASAPVPERIAEAPKTRGSDKEAAIDKRVIYVSGREKLEADYRHAVQLASSGRAGEAADQLREVLRQDASYSPARQALLRVLMEQRKTEEMAAVLTEGLDLQPNQTGWAISLARLAVERGDLAGAQRVLTRSYPHGSSSPEYVGFLGHVQYRQAHHKEAVETYLAATRLAPAEGRWWLGLGMAQEGEGRSTEAKESFRRALAAGTLNSDLSAIAEQKLR